MCYFLEAMGLLKEKKLYMKKDTGLPLPNIHQANIEILCNNHCILEIDITNKNIDVCYNTIDRNIGVCYITKEVNDKISLILQ